MGSGEMGKGEAARAPPLAALGALLVLLPSTAQSQTSAPPPSLTGLRSGGDLGHARLVLEFDKPLRAAPDLAVESASSLALVFSSSVGDLPREGAGFGPLRQWDLATADGVQARLIVSLNPGARIARRFGLPPARVGGPWRYVVDVMAGGPPSAPTAPPVELASIAPDPFAPLPVTRRGERRRRRESADLATGARRKVVVIDPGHGGFDPGARGLGVEEKDVNLAEALVLADMLRRAGRYEVVLTRASDVFVPLDERVRIARRAGADLFISLHADSAGADAAPHGASVYTLSDHGVSRTSEVIGPGEWTGRRSDPRVGPILLDLTQRDTLNRSAAFASLLIERIGREVDLLPRTHRDAGYFVLLAPDVPAVLLEMGFITSPLDQARLTDEASRARLAVAIGSAIDSYFTGTAPSRAPSVSGVARASGSWPESSPIRPG